MKTVDAFSILNNHNNAQGCVYSSRDSIVRLQKHM
jgi:hypothetical protein